MTFDGTEGHDALEALTKRFEAHERRHAEQIAEISAEMDRMRERFNQRQDMLARDLGERIASLALGQQGLE